MPYGTDTYGVEAFGSEGVAPNQTITQTAGIPSGEAFGAGGSVLRQVKQLAGIASAEAFGSTGAKINFGITQAAGIPSAEAFGVGGRIQLKVTQTAGIPSAEAFGVGGMASFLVRQLAGIPSEEAFGAGGQVLVNYIPGWSVKVMRLNGSVVAEVGRHKGLKFLKQLSGKGSGTITLLLEDALEMDLLDEELVWRVFYDGQWAYSFFSAAVEEKRVDANQSRTVTFAGPGIIECLEWGTVLPPGYPAWTNRTWSWTNVRAMKIWRDLFAAVQARGTIPAVTASFSDAADSNGAAWTDSISMEIEPGGSLYMYLEKLAAIAEADFAMTATFGLDVSKNFGTDLTDKVRFQIAGDQIKFTRGKDRSGVRNVAYAEGSLGGIQEASNGGSITAWGRREAYIQAGDSTDSSTTAQVAAALVDQSQDERIQITFAVLPDNPDRKVFHDYNIGDWIGAESDEAGITGDYRCVAVGVGIDTEGNASVELGLQSLFEVKQARLEKLQASGGGNSSVSSGLQSGLTPDGIINAVTSSDPPVAPTGLTLTTGANENRVYIDASWTSVAPSGADPVVEYEAELSRDGVGTVTVQRAVGAPVRFEPVEPGVSYSVRVRAISRLGRSSAFLGPQTIVAGTDPTVPAQVTGLVMGAAIRNITLSWNEGTELDVINGKGSYDVQIDTVNTFNSGNLRGKRVSATVMSFTDLPTQTPTLYYGRVRAVDSSGNAGPWSATASSTTQQAATGDITPLAIDSTLIANAAITNAKIANLAVDSAKISDVSAGKITTGTLTAALITLGSGGLFRAGRGLAPYHYLLMDENGIRFYTNGSAPYTGGTLSVDLNVNSGSALFTGAISGSTITGGTIQTAVSGQRIVLTTSPQISFYSGLGTESSPGRITGYGSYPGGGSYPTLSLKAPSVSGSAQSEIGMSGASVFVSAPNGFMTDSPSSYSQLSAASLHLYANGGPFNAFLTLNCAGGGNLQLRYDNRLDINCGTTNVGGTLNCGNLNAANTDVWALTADAVSCWSVDAQGIVACNDRDFRLRTISDSNHRIWYNSGIDGVEVYGNNRVRLASGGAARADFGNGGIYFYNVPFGSDADIILRIAGGSSQVLKWTSSLRYKENVHDLEERRKQEENPVWAMRLVNFNWKSHTAESADRLARLRPYGSVGFIAEEMHELAMDCVTYNAEEEPEGINESGVLAYAVAGLQYMKGLVDDLKQRVQNLEKGK